MDFSIEDANLASIFASIKDRLELLDSMSMYLPSLNNVQLSLVLRSSLGPVNYLEVLRDKYYFTALTDSQVKKCKLYALKTYNKELLLYMAYNYDGLDPQFQARVINDKRVPIEFLEWYWETFICSDPGVSYNAQIVRRKEDVGFNVYLYNVYCNRRYDILAWYITKYSLLNLDLLTKVQLTKVLTQLQMRGAPEGTLKVYQERLAGFPVPQKKPRKSRRKVPCIVAVKTPVVVDTQIERSLRDTSPQ